MDNRMVAYTKDIIGSRTFTVTAEDMRRSAEEAHLRAFDDAVADIERQIIAASRSQKLGIIVDVFNYNLETEDIDTIFALLEKQGFVLNYSDSGNHLCITWNDKYDKD